MNDPLGAPCSPLAVGTTKVSPVCVLPEEQKSSIWRRRRSGDRERKVNDEEGGMLLKLVRQLGQEDGQALSFGSLLELMTWLRVRTSPEMEKSGDVPVQQVEYSRPPCSFVSLPDECGRAVSPICKLAYPPPPPPSP